MQSAQEHDFKDTQRPSIFAPWGGNLLRLLYDFFCKNPKNNRKTFWDGKNDKIQPSGLIFFENFHGKFFSKFFSNIFSGIFFFEIFFSKKIFEIFFRNFFIIIWAHFIYLGNILSADKSVVGAFYHKSLMRLGTLIMRLGRILWNLGAFSET